MTTNTISKIIKHDSNGNIYGIPENEVNNFIMLDEAVQLADFLSAEWSDANDELSHAFGKYIKD